MKASKTPLNDLLIIEPSVHNDNRGYFFESYNKTELTQIIGREVDFVQDNHSFSKKNVLRGLHYQITHPQAKLVRVISGKVLDVSVDLRRNSATFGKHFCIELSADNKLMLWIPEGFAHGLLVLSGSAEYCYKVSEYWHPDDENCIRWDDPILSINWQLNTAPVLSNKDAAGKDFMSSEYFI